MPSLSLSVPVSIPNGPKVTYSRILTVEAYSQIEVAVPAGSSGLEVPLTSGTPGAASFLMVTADTDSTDLSDKLHAASAEARPLDQPQFLAGAGAISLLGAAPERLFLSHAGSEDTAVQVLPGAAATP
ncbi:MAG: hypothetical protein ACLFU2_02750 [Opitutales bacterium]